MRRIGLVSAMSVLCSTSGLSQPSSDEQQIRAIRNEFNAAIARQDVPRILSFLEEGFRVATSSGDFFNSRQEMGDAFSRTFAAFSDALYVRTPDVVEVSANGALASETGRWLGTWTTPGGPFRTGGRYAAYWRKANGRWLLHAELYVPLHCEGAGCGDGARYYTFNEDGTFRITRGDSTLETGTWSQDTSASPMGFDHIPNVNGKPGQYIPGIFAIDGDTLRISIVPPNPQRRRPTQFRSALEDRSWLLVYRRAP